MLGQLAEAGKACDCDSLRAAEEERLAELEVTTAAVNHRVLVRCPFSPTTLVGVLCSPRPIHLQAAPRASPWAPQNLRDTAPFSAYAAIYAGCLGHAMPLTVPRLPLQENYNEFVAGVALVGELQNDLTVTASPCSHPPTIPNRVL